MSAKEKGLWSLQKPLIGYKKIACKCVNDQKWVSAIAKLEIPTGAIVVRPYRCFDDFDDFDDDGCFVQDELRTDQCKTLEIIGKHPIDKKSCFSNYKSDFKFIEGEKQNSKLNTDIYKCMDMDGEDGIKFYTDIEKAKTSFIEIY